MHGWNHTHGTDDCFKLNRRKKRRKLNMSQNGKDKVSYKDLNAFINAKATAALNKAKKKRKERKDKEVKINTFNQFRSLNVESSDKEGKLKEKATTADSDSSDSDSESEASRLLSDASDSEGSVECDV
eukprot:6627903-Ditylum_brightwellii.AAC.1